MSKRVVDFFPASVPSLVCDPECDANAECKDFSGTPSCMCKAGFDGDGITCTGLLTRDMKW